MFKKNKPMAKKVFKSIEILPVKKTGKVIPPKQNKKIKNLQVYILYFLLNKILRAGQSYHCGGTLPMQKKKTKNLSTDLLGRPKNFKRIHCIDASVLPSIPATTITLSVMANAYRIGSES